MENSEENKGFLKKFLPIISLILLSVLLMVFFKYNKRDINRMFQEGKKNLALFYSQNLKPLFVQTDISEEDIFNFALYNTIPIDKTNNKVLTINKESNDNFIYEVKPSAFNPNTSNYEKFVKYLDLDQKQKVQADSILNIYKDKVYLSVLTDNKNTLAVNNQLPEVQKALLADILTFAHKVNPTKSNRLLSLHSNFYKDTDIKNYILSVKDKQPQEFIFITPDTAFTTVWETDTAELKRHLKEYERDRNISNKTDFNYKFKFDIKEKSKPGKMIDKTTNALVHLLKPDSSVLKVIVPVSTIPPKPELKIIQEAVETKLDRVAGSLRKISIVHKNDSTKRNRLHITTPGNENETLEFEFNFNDFSPIITETIEMFSKEKIQDWEKFGNRMDSIAQEFSKKYQDSLVRKTGSKSIR